MCRKGTASFIRICCNLCMSTSVEKDEWLSSHWECTAFGGSEVMHSANTHG